MNVKANRDVFDEMENKCKIEHYLQVSGSFEDGHATEKMIKEIMT